MAPIPAYIKAFLFLNVLLMATVAALLLEVQRAIPSGVWNSVHKGNLVDILYALSIAAILRELTLTVPPWALYAIALFYTIATAMVVVTVYLLIRPLLKGPVAILNRRGLGVYSLALFLWYALTTLLPYLRYPPFQEPGLFYLFLALFLLMVLYFGYAAIYISESYKRIGFVRRPFFAAFIGTVAIVLSVLLMIWSADIGVYYYYLFLCFTASAFVFIYYFRFMIEYPSLLQPKWRGMMPLELVKVATTIFIALLAASLYLTLKPPLAPILISLPALALPLAILLGYMRRVMEKTKLSYWGYLQAGLYIHALVSFYVMGLVYLLWPDLPAQARFFALLFVLLLPTFYAFYLMDMRGVAQGLEIPVSTNLAAALLDILRFTALFSLVLSGISISRGSGMDGTGLESSPALLFFTAFFLIAYSTYLRVTHRGFEELLKKGLWTELSYLSSFATFIAVYLFYTSAGEAVKVFPYHDLFFPAYFLILVIEVASTKTLAFKGKEREVAEIEDLLQYYTWRCIRADFLENIWREVGERYVPHHGPGIGFDPSTRTFNLRSLDEKSRMITSVAILLDFYKSPEEAAKVTPEVRTLEEVRGEISTILGEKVLLLPEDLRKGFREEAYYPVLLQRVLNELLEEAKTFVPPSGHASILKKLATVGGPLEGMALEGGKIKVPPSVLFGREAFTEYFKVYLRALGELFPFEHTLLRGLIKKEVEEVLSAYNFTMAELLDIVPTGLQDFDEATEGGLVRTTSTLLLAEETKAKRAFLDSFVAQGAKSRDTNLYATSRVPPREIVQLLMPGDRGIDLYTAAHTSNQITGLKENGSITTAPLNTTLLQHSLVRDVKRFPREVHKRVVLDVYSDLLRYHRWEELLEILCRQLEGFRRWNCTLIVALDPNALKGEELEALKRRFDNVLLISGKDRKSGSLAVLKLYGGTPPPRSVSLQ